MATADSAKITLETTFGIDPARLSEFTEGEAQSVLSQAASTAAAEPQPVPRERLTAIAIDSIENLEAAILATTSEVIYQ